MIEVIEVDDGVFTVTMTAMHYDWLDACSNRTNMVSEAVLSLWLAAGISSMSELCKPLEHPIPPTGEPSGGTMVGDILTVFGIPDLGTNVVFRQGVPCEPYEYCCSDCGQLRISFIVSDTCANCGSHNITKGKPGTLKKE